jgi:hypothetical protein
VVFLWLKIPVSVCDGREKSMDIVKSKELQRENKPKTSALLTNLLDILKKNEPELCSPALKRLEARREFLHHQ